jgi:acetyltransferase
MMASAPERGSTTEPAGDMALTPRGLDRLFAADSIAVVGASQDPQKWGYQALESILAGGYGGAVYAINPKGGEVFGLPMYASLDDLPEVPDVVVISVPARFVPPLIDEAAAAGAGVAIVLAKGFREAGNGDLQEELQAAIARAGIRVVGPNVMGLTIMALHLNTMPWPRLESPGPLGIIGQSGTVTAALAEWATRDGLGVSAILNTGNQADVCEADFVEMLDADSATRAIALHVEGLKDGPRFLEAVRAAGKPVVVLKSGGTASGRKAAASHTGSLAGRDEVFSGACRQAGAVRAGTLSDLYDYAKALAMLTEPRPGRTLFLSTSGGSGALAVDAAELAGLPVSELPEGFVDDLRELGPWPASNRNPLDLDTDAAADFEVAARLAIERGVADRIVLGFGDPVPGAAEVAARLAAELPGGIVSYYLGGGDMEVPESRAMHACGVPVYPTPERAVRALAACVGWQRAHGAPAPRRVTEGGRR